MPTSPWHTMQSEYRNIIVRLSIIIIIIYYREACAIQLEDTVIVTGGVHSYTRVQEYNLQGSVARLPDLNTGRFNHACGHYTHNGQLVSSIVTFLMTLLNSLCQYCLIIVMCGAGVYSHRRIHSF